MEMIGSHKVAALLVLLVLLSAQTATAQSGPPISTDKLFERLGVDEGITACEIGAGDGTLTIAAARAVGPTGRVYTNELGEKLAALKDAAAASGLAQITVVSGDAGSTNFPAASCDALFLRHVYHHFANPTAMNAAIFAAVKPRGRVAVVDFIPPGDEAPTPAGRARDGMHGVQPDTVVREMKAAGFETVADERGQRWFMVLLTRPAQ